MRCFSVFFTFLFCLLCLSIHMCVCVCVHVNIYLSLSLCAISYSEQEKEMDCQNLDWSFYSSSSRSRLSIFIRQVAPIAARSANNEEKTMYVQEGLGFEYEYGHMVKRRKRRRRRKFSRCYMWHPVVKKNISFSSHVIDSFLSFVDKLSFPYRILIIALENFAMKMSRFSDKESIECV